MRLRKNPTEHNDRNTSRRHAIGNIRLLSIGRHEKVSWTSVEVASPCARLQKMAICRNGVTTSSWSANPLQVWSTYGIYPGFLANLAISCAIQRPKVQVSA